MANKPVGTLTGIFCSLITIVADNLISSCHEYLNLTLPDHYRQLGAKY